MEKVKQLLVGLNYKEVADSGGLNDHDGDLMMLSHVTAPHQYLMMMMVILLQATAPYQYLMYMRCLALQLSAINSVSTGDVVLITFILILIFFYTVFIINNAIGHAHHQRR